MPKKVINQIFTLILLKLLGFEDLGHVDPNPHPICQNNATF